MNLQLRWVGKRKVQQDYRRDFSWMMFIFLLFYVCVCLGLSHCFSIICESILLTVDLPLLTFVVRRDQQARLVLTWHRNVFLHLNDFQTHREPRCLRLSRFSSFVCFVATWVLALIINGDWAFSQFPSCCEHVAIVCCYKVRVTLNIIQ